jgi:hypothetical protein
MIKLEVWDNEFNRYGVLNSFSMIQYNNMFSDVGAFELVCPLSEDNINLLFGSKDRILWIEDEVAGIIQFNERVAGSDNDNISVKGSLLPVMLNWRYIYPQYSKKGYPDDIVRELVTQNLVSSGVRAIPRFSVQADTPHTLEQTVYQQTGSYVGMECTSIAQSHNFGFCVEFRPKTEQFVFRTLYGKDRTLKNTSGNKSVVFSRQFNNILESSYLNNREDYRNTAIIAGEGEGAQRVVSTIESPDVIGFSRRELFVDARDIQSIPDDIEGLSMTPEEYQIALQQRGAEKLQSHIEIESFESVVRNDNSSQFLYGRDYFLGDKVTVVDTLLNISTSAVVTEVTVTLDEKGYSVEPTFGYSQPTLMQKLRKKGVL